MTKFKDIKFDDTKYLENLTSVTLDQTSGVTRRAPPPPSPPPLDTQYAAAQATIVLTTSAALTWDDAAKDVFKRAVAASVQAKVSLNSALTVRPAQIRIDEPAPTSGTTSTSV